jgi:hypothetical protein
VAPSSASSGCSAIAQGSALKRTTNLWVPETLLTPVDADSPPGVAHRARTVTTTSAAGLDRG